MKLHYTPKSHFARKDLILLDALSVDVELIDVGNVADNNPEIFAQNPLMKVPTLVDGEWVIFESDLIAQYIVNKFDPEDRFGVMTDNWNQLNARAVMNGVMMAEVELIMAERTGIDTHNYPRFEKFRDTVEHGLQWLESHAGIFVGQPSYAGFHLVCLWDHLQLYKMFNLDYAQLKLRVKDVSNQDYVMKSSPL